MSMTMLRIASRTAAWRRLTTTPTRVALLSARKFLIILALVLSAQTAIADEANDAVQVLTKLWKGKSDDGTSTQFEGDSRTLRIRLVADPRKDGVVRNETTEAPFKFLQTTDPSDYLIVTCHKERKCVLVSCLFKRACVSSTAVMHDPIYRDPERERTVYSKQWWAAGWANPSDIERVTQALRILIQLNAPQQFDTLKQK